jgi:hypothetical protein
VERLPVCQLKRIQVEGRRATGLLCSPPARAASGEERIGDRRREGMPEGPEEVLETIGKVVKGKTKVGHGQSVFSGGMEKPRSVFFQIVFDDRRKR